MPKTLLVFCDGTTFDANISGIGNPENYVTNVARLARAVCPRSTEGNDQIVFYQSGTASEADFVGGRWKAETFAKMVDSATGRFVGTRGPDKLHTTILTIFTANKIREAYVFLAQNYVKGDNICLFGFSRGAYTVRKVATMIDIMGLMDYTELEKFPRAWAQLQRGHVPTDVKADGDVKIKFLGVWDTVGTVFNYPDVFGIKDDKLPGCVEKVYHALAMHENREKFLPTRFSPANDNKLVEVWFPGSHGDVGGCTKNHELGDISLFWMAAGLQKEKNDTWRVDLNKDVLFKSRSKNPAPWGAREPTNEYYVYSSLFSAQNRLKSGDINTLSKFHQSVLNTPKELDWIIIRVKSFFKWASYDMVTVKAIEQQLNIEITATTCVPLEQLEKDFKESWLPAAASTFVGGVDFDPDSCV
ncbi:hypothetical protein B0H12DRAFT_1332107 [Mycena haematopus]|nr:hypothetical protein B0H12DRAFT_1332107 [Mycena haematopus]